MPGGFSAKTFRKSAIFGPLCFCTSTATSTALPMNLAMDGLQLDSGDIGFLTNSGWMLKQKSVSYTFSKQVWNKYRAIIYNINNTISRIGYDMYLCLWDVSLLWTELGCPDASCMPHRELFCLGLRSHVHAHHKRHTNAITTFHLNLDSFYHWHLAFKSYHINHDAIAHET